MFKQGLRWLGQFALAVVIIWYLTYDNRLDLTQFRDVRFSPQNVALLIIAMVCVFFGLVLMTFRLRLFLRLQHFEIPFSQILNLTLIGPLVGIILPGPVGGDLAKAGFLWMKVTSGRGVAIGALVVDRIVGLYSLLLLGALGLLFMFATGHNAPVEPIYLILPIGACLGPIFFLVIRCDFAKSRIFPIIASFLPDRVVAFCEECFRYVAVPRLLFLAIFLSILNHGLVLVSFVVAARLIGNSLPISSHLAIDPIAMTINAIPLTPGGIGLTEASFSFLFQMVGSSDGAFIGLLGRSIQYLVFVLTGVPALIAVTLRTGSKFSRQGIGEDRPYV